MEFCDGFRIVKVFFNFILNLIGNPDLYQSTAAFLICYYCFREMRFKFLLCFLRRDFPPIVNDLIEFRVFVELVDVLENQYLVRDRIL